jgi:hypothetical protein
VDEAGEVHAEKGEGRIWDRVDEFFQPGCHFWTKLKIFTAEGHDHGGRILSCHACHSVTVKAGAVHQEIEWLLPIFADESPLPGMHPQFADTA